MLHTSDSLFYEGETLLPTLRDDLPRRQIKLHFLNWLNKFYVHRPQFLGYISRGLDYRHGVLDHDCAL